MRHLLSMLLDKNAAKRPSVEALRFDPWLTAEGTALLPEQTPNVIVTDEDIANTLRRIDVAFTVYKAKVRFKSILKADSFKNALLATIPSSTSFHILDRATSPGRRPSGSGLKRWSKDTTDGDAAAPRTARGASPTPAQPWR